jgi:uncharacterized membrane protein YphA (DoxX/SURF4 family)
MQLGRVLLRVTVGSIFFEHGTQKLFGWFDLVSALALAESAPGPWSLDALLKSGRRGVGWAAAALAAAATGSTLPVALGKRQPPPTVGREPTEERGEQVAQAATG